jgi:hypothetical protein
MLQLAMKSASRCTRVEKHCGSGSEAKSFPPVYSPKLSSLRLVRLPIELGTLPVRWLPNSCSSSSPTSRPISGGMRPVSPQRQMHRRRRVTRLQSSLGIGPTSPMHVTVYR